MNGIPFALSHKFPNIVSEWFIHNAFNMKIKIGLFLFFSFLLLNPSSAQKPGLPATRHAAFSQPRYFNDLWKQVDSLTNLGQPRSALEVVNNIYRQAKTENNDPQFIKSIIYRIRLNSEFQENYLVLSIRDLQKEIQSSAQPAKQVLQSILAEVYLKYYQNNQYRFRDRSQVLTPLPDSIETWDLTAINHEICRFYLLSLENPDSLKRISINRFESILDQEVFNDKKAGEQFKDAARFIPTLYDFLAGRALDYFTSDQESQTIPSQRFEVDRTWYFAPTFNFISNRMLIPADTSAPASFALRIFRDLAAFHLPDKDPRALIEVELKRFEFVHRTYTLPGKDSLYLEALRQFDKAQAGSSWGTSVSYTLASYLNEKGQLYQPLVSDIHKWDIRSAIEVCDNAIKRFPDSDGAKNCRILAKSIQDNILRLTAEHAVPVDKPSLVLAEVRNIKQLYFRLVKTDPEVYAAKAGTLDPVNFFKYLTALQTTKSWSQIFPSDGDYQVHHAEIIIPEVPMGFWVLLGSSSKDFNNANQVFSITPFWSSQISYISKLNNDGSLGYFLLDRETGAPLKNVKAESWQKNYNYRDRQYLTTKLQDFISDGQGFFSVPSPENSRNNSTLFLKIHYKDDFLITDNFYQYPKYTGKTETSLLTMFYTDRAIYRPGQVVYFKGIILEKSGALTKIKNNQPTKVVFTDANGQKISEQTFTSNEFGSFNGSFTAPQGVLLGQMAISNESGSVHVSVEEYKRPTFEVIYEPLEGNYRLGESITVKGKASAFAGNAIDGASVKYRVVRSASFPFWDWGWRRPMPASPGVEICSGTTTTDASGKYSFIFPATPDPSTDKEIRPVFDFELCVDVTDINGETQSVRQTVSVGYQALLIEFKVPDLVNLSNDSAVKITTTNLNGRTTPAFVSVTLQKLIQPDRLFKPRLWERPDISLMTREEFYKQFPYNIYGNDSDPSTWSQEKIVFEKKINTLTDSVLNINLSASGVLAPGSYLLVLKAMDPFGVAVEKKQFFTAYSPLSKEVPVNTLNWFVPLKTTGEPGENARLLVGSKEDDVTVIYEIRLHDSLISRELIKLNNRAMMVDIPIKEQYRGNFAVNFVFVRHNRAFQNSQLISVPYTNKKLDIAFGTFRNKIDPGSRESWKIRISNAAGHPAGAEFLAAMYDASLDLFRPLEWTFNLYQRYSGLYPWDVNNSFRLSAGQWHSPVRENENYIFHPGLKLNWFGLNYFGGSGGHVRYGRSSRDKSMGMVLMESSANDGTQSAQMPPPPEMKQDEMNATGKAVANDSLNVTEQERIRTSATAGASIRVRRDFRETAFFYPSLVTDSTGSLVLQFTAPESLTRWKFLGLAHTKKLDYGLVEKEIVTSKNLMVFPNAPRFVRQGDTVFFSAKIVNLSDRDLAGNVTLDLSDAITQRTINNWIDTVSDPTTGIRPAGQPGDETKTESQNPEPGLRNQIFQVKRDQSVLVFWKLVIPVNSGTSVLQYRITGSSESFSDGEEKAIPVLSNRMMVTESLPLPVRGKGTTGFEFEKLLHSGLPGQKDPSLLNYRLTLEFASNPAWYAIQALPVLNNKKYESADAVFAAFWSNSLAEFIANSNPKIKAVFESWKNLTPDALKSNLAKNQELKSALLQETPWVMDAASETERKQKLGLYFDPNTLEATLRENLNKLKKLQTPSGGWTWFAGMPENRWISQNIITGMGQLHHLGIASIRKDPETWSMILKGIQFLDQELVRDFEHAKKQDSGYLRNNHLGTLQIQYLYARSFLMNDPGFPIPDQGVNFREAFDYYKHQAEKYWLQNNRYMQGMMALALNRLGNNEIPALILKSLSEKALHSNEMGMYWAEETGFYWYQAPIETQALMVEAFDEIARDEKTVEDLKIWLLKQKQTQDWRSPQATVEACYALLLRGTDLLSEEPGVKISIGKEKISSDKLIDTEKEAGTGYFQVSWSGNQIRPDMGKISISKSTTGVAWGALYWQYFENLDKITTAATPMKLEKKIFVERNTPSGPVIEPITQDQANSGMIKIGDKLKVRIVLTVDRDLEFVHMKDMRASSFEPYSVASASPLSGIGYRSQMGDGLSGYHYQDGLGYYQSTSDQATNFFFDNLPKGTFVFEYALKVNAAGDYSNGITTIQCMYAPEFAAHSEGTRVKVDFK